MGHINSIEINRFRGIKQLEITDFSNINLIVGDNNSGKTTF
jgi:AAA15 family ATPase/GTPase